MTFLFPIILSIFFIKFQIGKSNPIHGTNYRYIVSGTLNCFDKNTGTFKPAAKGEKIDLYEDDFWGDDHMATAYTDKDGKFSLVGTEDEGNEPEPYLYIDGACGGWIRYLCLYPRVQEQRVIINMGRGGDKDTVSINGTTVLALLPMARNCNDLGIWPKSILGPEEGGGH